MSYFPRLDCMLAHRLIKNSIHMTDRD
jgi:hypothetical protein